MSMGKMPSTPPLFRPGHSQTKSYDQERDRQQWRRWYKTARWQRLRDRQLHTEPLCRMCRERGITAAATVCDHVERHGGDYQRFWAGPFQSLCASCHSGDKQVIERGRGVEKSTTLRP